MANILNVAKTVGKVASAIGKGVNAVSKALGGGGDGEVSDVTAYYLPSGEAGDLNLSGVNTDNYLLPRLGGNYMGGLQLGTGPDLPALDVSTPCTFVPTVIVMTSLPAMYMPGGEMSGMAYIIKELMECHAKQVSNIDFGYNLDTASDALVGHDSQTFAVPTKTKRGQVTPSFSFTELSGNIVWNTFKRWIWDINHPDTNVSLAQGNFPGAWTMSTYSCSFLAIQFDPTMRPERIIDAAHYCNVFPTETGSIGFERSIGQIKAVPERSINFQGIVQHNDTIKALAIAVANELKLHVHNYDLAPAFRLGSSNVDGVLEDIQSGTGDERWMNAKHREAVDDAHQELNIDNKMSNDEDPAKNIVDATQKAIKNIQKTVKSVKQAAGTLV